MRIACWNWEYVSSVNAAPEASMASRPFRSTTAAHSGDAPGPTSSRRDQKKEIPPRTGETLLHLDFYATGEAWWGGERLRPAERCEKQPFLSWDRSPRCGGQASSNTQDALRHSSARTFASTSAHPL